MIEGISGNSQTNFNVDVYTTQNRGMTPEEIAKICADKIVSVSQDSHPVIRDQAIEFKQSITRLLSFYMKQVIKSDRTTIYNELVKSGHSELAEVIRRL
tara:strand:- start:1004 stop:1300 length:297 start_codon:yes stop_codon:yes gene_type:complete